MENNPCDRRFRNKSKIINELVRYLVDPNEIRNGKIDKTKAFETLTFISSNSKDYIQDTNMNISLFKKLLHLFNKDELCIILDNIIYGETTTEN